MKLVHRNTSGPLPTSSFSLVNDAGEVIDYAQLRHRPSCSDGLPPDAGNHVFYTIAEPHRGQRHGKTLLRLVLDEARRIGLDRVRLTVEDTNPTSRHIVEGAGGVLVGEVTSRRRGALPAVRDRAAPLSVPAHNRWRMTWDYIEDSER